MFSTVSPKFFPSSAAAITSSSFNSPRNRQAHLRFVDHLHLNMLTHGVRATTSGRSPESSIFFTVEFGNNIAGAAWPFSLCLILLEQG